MDINSVLQSLLLSARFQSAALLVLAIMTGFVAILTVFMGFYLARMARKMTADDAGLYLQGMKILEEARDTNQLLRACPQH